MSLCLTFTMRNFRKQKRLAKTAFTECIKGVVEGCLIMRPEFCA